jgi:hypothetical protein
MRHPMKLALFVALVTMIAGVAIAAKIKVRVEYDKTFDFRVFHTYAWHPEGAGEVKMLQNTDDPEQIRSRLEPVIRQAVDQELAKRGITQATSGTPDFYVNYYLLIGPGSSSQYQGQFIGAVPAWGIPDFMMSTTSLKAFEQGTLILDVAAVSLKSVVWRGVGEAEIDRQRTDAERHKRIQDGVREMLKNFPPKYKK